MDDQKPPPPPPTGISEALATNSRLYAAISKTVNQVIEKTDLTAKHAPTTGSGNTGEDTREHVKRPMNAFMVYARAARKELALQYPNLSYRKLSKILGQLWKMLDDKEKQPFIDEAERLRRKHRSEHPDYKYQPKKKSKKAKINSEEPTSQSGSRKVSLTHDLSRKIGEQLIKNQSIDPRFSSWNHDSLALQAATGISLPIPDSYRAVPSHFSHASNGINQYLSSVSETFDNKQLFSGMLTDAAHKGGGFLLEDTNKNIPSNIPTGTLHEPRILNQYNVLQRPITSMTGCHGFPNSLPYFPSIFQKTTGLFEGEQPVYHQTADRLMPATTGNRTRGELFLRV